VVIPKEIRKELGLREGDEFEVAAQGNTLLLRRMSHEFPDWRSLRGAFGRTGQTTSEMLAEGRREEFEKEQRP
jgi:AbrB family looped-hinge helix DNA binding protein